MQRPLERDQRARHFESYEERLALSAEPVADFSFDHAADEIFEASSTMLLPLAAEGHGWTEVANARDQFGLRGGNQTVAIIDSGIAYDHIALGGGLGKAHRVVGGWDFAENDANPYDDGPAGYHGTHVAGIVGANDKRYAGLAPDVDLVALRVFDDQGNGSFAWVEQALAWIHQHRNDFANPITTVNLSLGTAWNSSSLPNWATLEEELKQLAADGLFISVAAGNSFLTYNAPGLSYPAASQHVTPVASVGANGNLSKYSQRHDRVLAAPGEKVMSTLPDHFYGGDGIKNDWGATSGTSMAAPYVAGASVLVREAMQDLGITQITQGTIYDLFRRTADTIFDTATNTNYRRLNLQRALDTLVGADDYGSTSASATSLGRLSTTIQVSGTIGRTSDQDFFQFVADKSGKATLSLSGNQQLGANWQQLAGGRVENGKLILDVVAGHSYTLGVAGGGQSIGKFSVDMKLEAAPAGNPASGLVKIVGNTATVTGTAGDDTFHWQAGSQQQIIVNGVSHTLSGITQVQFDGGGGKDSLVLVGGSAAESVTLRPGSAELVGATYRVSSTGVETILVTGGIGDRATLYDSAGNDVLNASPTSTTLRGRGYSNQVRGFEQVVVFATAGGIDNATLRDSRGADQLDASAAYSWLRGSGYSIRAEGFENVTVLATSGSGDIARLVGSSGNDVLNVFAGTRSLTGGGTKIFTQGFQSASFDGGGGSDTIDFYTASKSSSLYGRRKEGALTDGAFATQFTNVETILANVRSAHHLQTDLDALDFVFKRIGTS